ncbi:MAG: hypothetical protein RL189_990 [Pseudomonadota bacterium]|jgi:hypothetical protein
MQRIFAAIVVLFALLQFARWPAWWVVLCGAGLSVVM